MASETSVFIDKIIAAARKDVEAIVKANASCVGVERQTIARYVLAFAVNFTDWIGKSLQGIKSPDAEVALIRNLVCEMKEDHISMLFDFGWQAGAVFYVGIGTAEQGEVFKRLAQIRKFFTRVETCGLVGLSFLTALESISDLFIPVLEQLGASCGVTDFTYINHHGEADKEHTVDLVNALKAEASWHNDPKALIHAGAINAVALLGAVFTGEAVLASATHLSKIQVN
jgi:hypothetical protein